MSKNIKLPPGSENKANAAAYFATAIDRSDSGVIPYLQLAILATSRIAPLFTR
jgi:hypothetical protein